MSEVVYIINTPPSWLKTPPLALVYLKTYLKQKGIKTEILDLNIFTFKLLALKSKEWLILNKNFEETLFSVVEKNFPIELAELMKKSGCYNLFVGLESASDKILKAMNKGFSKSSALAFFKILHEAGLHFEISLIFGYPGEDEKDFKETLDFIVKNKKIIPKIAQANPFVDYLGNFPHEALEAQKVKKRINKFMESVESEKIRYTKSFINNLAYGN